MVASRITLRRLRKYGQYLARFLQQHQSAYFEHLVAEAFAHILHLDLYTSDDDDPSVPYRVTWFGGLQPIRKAPSGEDARACAHGYIALIEPTRATGANQWTQEFGPCCQHYEEFIQTPEIYPNDVYVVLVAPEINERTWNSIHEAGFNWVLMTVEDLTTVLQTSILAFTMSHSQLRQLFNSLIRCSHGSDSLEEFRNRADDHVSMWQKDVLNVEKKTFLAVRSYRCMQRIGRTHVGIGEILQRLERDPVAKQYIHLAGARLGSWDLERSVLEQGLGCPAGQTLAGEILLSPIPLVDFKAREGRIVTTAEEMHG